MQQCLHVPVDNVGGQSRDDGAHGQLDQLQSSRLLMRTEPDVVVMNEHEPVQVQGVAAEVKVGDSVWWCPRLFDRRMIRWKNAFTGPFTVVWHDAAAKLYYSDTGWCKADHRSRE